MLKLLYAMMNRAHHVRPHRAKRDTPEETGEYVIFGRKFPQTIPDCPWAEEKFIEARFERAQAQGIAVVADPISNALMFSMCSSRLMGRCFNFS